MNRKIWNMAGIIVIILFIGFMSVSSHAASSISDEKKKQKELEAELKNTNKFLENLKNQAGNAEKYVEKMDSQLGKLADNIYKLEKDAETKKGEIEDTKKQLAAAESDVEKQYEDMKLRIRYMYENGDADMAAMLFGSQNISDIFDRAEYINKIVEYDRDMLEELKNTREDIERTELKLEEELKNLNEMLAEVADEKHAVEVLISAKQKEIKVFEKEMATTAEEIAALKEEIKIQEALVKELEEIERRRKEEEAKKNIKLTYDGGTLIWPLPGKTRVSSPFGYRKDPISGEYNAWHNGIDVPAPTGTNILAAYDGEVAWAYSHYSAGEWVGIDHGSGLYTVYMHMSKILVKTGDKVKKGDVIGLVGSTGRSTGPHLHFGIRNNGTYVDPLTYAKPS